MLSTFLNLNFAIGLVSLFLQGLVIYNGYRLATMLNPIRYWTKAWVLFVAANSVIEIRRVIGMVFVACGGDNITPGMSLVWPNSYEYLLQIVCSVLLLMFVRNVRHLYQKYFNNGVNIKSWKDEQQDVQYKEFYGKFIGDQGKRDEARDEQRDGTRDQTRDEYRDAGRDPTRDQIRDVARDLIKDTGVRDDERDKSRDEYRDAGRDPTRDQIRDGARDLIKDEGEDK